MSVRTASAADLRPVSLVLARAFRDDPVHGWILPSELDWALSSSRFFTMVMQSALRNASAFTTAPFEGAALWFAPYPEAGAVARAPRGADGHVPGARPARHRGGPRTARGGSAAPAAAALVPGGPRHRPAPPGPRRRLRHCSRGCSRAATPSARLPLSSLRKRENIPFYERHGFETEGRAARNAARPARSGACCASRAGSLDPLLVAVAVCALTGVLFGAGAVSAARRRHPLRCGAALLGALALLLTALAIRRGRGRASGLSRADARGARRDGGHTYPLGPQRLEAHFRFPDGREARYELSGDELAIRGTHPEVASVGEPARPPHRVQSSIAGPWHVEGRMT